MPIDPSVNIAKAADLYSQAQKSGITTSEIPNQNTDGPNQSQFSGLLSTYLDRANEIGKQGEAMSIKGIQGEANVSDVVTAVAEAEVTLQTVVAVRDKVVEAYKEILRMPI
ncbi:flagellar hook-basal body complex protein FliE [Magnetovibrio sp. PR-2]|uniref:flagellar hook-basal body complex protein FliE n=1 Tax=Magnetovibrio sp. PR-2 TaxID=3120356 RepID=UPI002FCDF7FB